MQKIGFIGLGHMGNPMVKNLLKQGYEVQVFDVSQTAMQSLQKDGALAAQSVKSLVAECSTVITMLQTSDQVKQCCLEEGGIFHKLESKGLFIDCSSIDIASSKALHQEASQRGIAMLDAPVSGGVAAAQAGTLTFMVGGSDKNYLLAKPILSAMGRAIIYAGEGSSGAAAKICNNMILGVSMIAVGEAFALAHKLGLQPEKLFEICSVSSGQCWSITKYCPWPNVLPEVPSSHDFKPGFTAKMMLKDLNLGQEAADFADFETPLGKHATELYQQFVEQGHAEMDFSGIITMLAEDEFKN